LLALLLALVADAGAVTISWVPVGNPGNQPDTGVSSLGAVNYSFNIGKYDVTVSQYVEFLNAKDPIGLNTLGLYNSNMSNTSNFGEINFNAGNASGSKYSAIAGDANHPVNYVTWYDAIRFANWMNNGQGSGDTESGAYTLLGGTPTPSNAASITRNAGATIVLPNANEWEKAAYYDPRTPAQGGPPLSDHHYWFYPTTSDTAPHATGPTATPNSANYNQYNGAAANLTNVGAYTGTTSPYGAFDMGGDVRQWNESIFADGDRGWGGARSSTARLRCKPRLLVAPVRRSRMPCSASASS
jgi:formylglycine-generating enzyme required for sulfatase activity